MRVLFAPAAGRDIGGGHVMRCLSLAAALAARGAECRFAAPEAARPIVERFGSEPFPLDDDLLAAAREHRPEVVVIDDYGVDAAAEARLLPFTRLLAVIDDLADRPHLADVLLDPGHGREARDYGALAPPDAELLIGPSYALLRPEFAGRKAAAGDPVRRVFVSFGLSDVGGIAGRAVQALAPLAPEAGFDVALSSGAESLPALAEMAAADPRIAVHADAADVAGLMAAADLAVGAGGGGTWERACLGLPSIAVAVADNQRPLLGRLGREEALIAVDGQAGGWETALAEAFRRMLDDAALRTALAVRARSLCDGLGAERAAEAILARLNRS